MKKILSVLLLVISLLALTVVNVFAAPVQSQAFAITRTPLAPGLGDAAKAALSNYLKREQNFLTLQETHLQRTGQIASTAQQLIDAAKAEGKDTTSLETALAQFNTDIANAQSEHDQAASILGAHNGFDANGSVTDLSAARQTVVDARTALRSAHASIVQAVTTFRQAVEQWRTTNSK